MTEGPTPQSFNMLKALNRQFNVGRLHIYNGTVDPAEVARRRAKNKVARQQRKVNRRAAK